MRRRQLKAARPMLAIWIAVTLAVATGESVEESDAEGRASIRVRRQWGGYSNWGGGGPNPHRHFSDYDGFMDDGGFDYGRQRGREFDGPRWRPPGGGGFQHWGDRGGPRRPAPARPRPAPPPQIDRQQWTGSDENRAGSQRCGITIEINRIVKGEVALPGEFPWQAALAYTKGGEVTVECGGVLVHPRFVLTAAHCLDPVLTAGYKLKEVRLGVVDQALAKSEGRTLVPDRQIVHPGYRSGTKQRVRNLNDIALLRLPQEAPYTDFIRPICLPSQSNVRSGAKMVVAGWGITESGMSSQKLMFAQVPEVESGDCGRKWDLVIPDSQVCAGGGEKDSCRGDSGGPLIQTGPDASGEMVFLVVGLVSFGTRGCGVVGFPAGHTRVASYRQWIDQTIRDNS